MGWTHRQLGFVLRPFFFFFKSSGAETDGNKVQLTGFLALARPGVENADSRWKNIFGGPFLF